MENKESKEFSTTVYANATIIDFLILKQKFFFRNLSKGFREAWLFSIKEESFDLNLISLVKLKKINIIDIKAKLK